MAVVSAATRYARSTASAQPCQELPLTLAHEHMLLLGQVTARAEELLDVAADGRWPADELAALAGYTRVEVLRQTADEERLLFPAARSHAAGRLARDHARLRAGAERAQLRPGQPAAAAEQQDRRT